MAKRQNPKLRFTYQQLDGLEFKRRMEDSFSPVHLTSISIIQGVALGILCQQIFSMNQPVSLIPNEHSLASLYALISVIIIIGLSYEYNWLVGMYRWSQRFLDTLLPFAMGFWEIGAIINLSNPQRWWILISFFNLCTILATFNTWKNCKAEMFTDKEVFALFKSSISKSVLMTISATIYSVIISLIYTPLKNRLPWYSVDLPASTLYIGAIVLLLWRDQRLVDRAHGMLSIKR